MKLYLLLPALLCCIMPGIVDEQHNIPTSYNNDTMAAYQDLITPSLLATHLYYLASDEMQGRETGSQGQKLAAGYLAAQYQLLGLLPKGTVRANNFSNTK